MNLPDPGLAISDPHPAMIHVDTGPSGARLLLGAGVEIALIGPHAAAYLTRLAAALPIARAHLSAAELHRPAGTEHRFTVHFDVEDEQDFRVEHGMGVDDPLRPVLAAALRDELESLGLQSGWWRKVRVM
ncbi:hypothetical protein O4J56_04750 [Nocardiopsis sp. RSe5-2]|uniref:Uncharacterized protein n=1 Tax=Nocardiopsis endophytica TaxID=3018445 RepID=A0ABT4TZ14_9ACTN|nr:hypothetical protein [Nocardiopsis endophytica]MDA2809938.1 hypothetical protein [Nocardiopsis endophytica]